MGLWLVVVADLANLRLPAWCLDLLAVVFFSDWIFAHDANMQKYYFKRNPSHVLGGYVGGQNKLRIGLCRV